MPEYTIYTGDCLDILPTLEANSVDSIVTDPPYGLWRVSMAHRLGSILGQNLGRISLVIGSG